jgi:anti-anti-sigma factor
VRQAVRDRLIEVARLGPRRVVVSATGALDGGAASELTETLLPLVAAPRSRVIVDLAGAHIVDDTVVGVLTAAAHVARRERGELVVVTADPRLERRFEQIGPDGLMRLERTLRDGTAPPVTEPA